MRNALAIMLACLALVPACAKYQPRPISAERSADAFAGRRLDDPDLKRFIEGNVGHELAPWPMRSWDFTDLTLAAFYFSPELDAERAKWNEAEAGVTTAKQRPNPILSLTPGFSSNPGAGVSPWLLTLNLDLPIETAGKRGYRIDAAEHRSDAARLGIAAAAWRVRSRLRSALLSLYAGEHEGAAVEKESASAEAVAAMAESRLAAGAVSRLELSQARATRDELRVAAGELNRQKLSARADTAAAIGVPESALAGIELPLAVFERFPAASDLPGDSLRRRALTSRPDVLAALADYAAAESDLQLEIAKQYPDLNLGPGYEYDQGNNKWTLGLSVALPVFHHNQGPIASALARRSASEARFNDLQARVIGELDRARAGYEAELARYRAAQELSAEQERARQSIEAGFKAGARDRLELESARQESSRGERARLAAQVELHQALGALEDALEVPLAPPAPAPAAPEHDPRPREGEGHGP